MFWFLSDIFSLWYFFSLIFFDIFDFVFDLILIIFSIMFFDLYFAIFFFSIYIFRFIFFDWFIFCNRSAALEKRLGDLLGDLLLRIDQTQWKCDDESRRTVQENQILFVNSSAQVFAENTVGRALNDTPLLQKVAMETYSSLGVLGKLSGRADYIYLPFMLYYALNQTNGILKTDEIKIFASLVSIYGLVYADFLDYANWSALVYGLGW